MIDDGNSHPLQGLGAANAIILPPLNFLKGT